VAATYRFARQQIQFYTEEPLSLSSNLRINSSIMSNYDRWLSFISLWFEISLKIVIKVVNLIINNLYKFPSKLFSFSLFHINVYIELN
jgi:hypothetical protein